MPRFDPYASIQTELTACIDRFKHTKDESEILEAARLIRTINKYPTPTFDHEGEIDEVIKCIERDVSDCITPTDAEGRHYYMKCRYLQGITLCRHLFPEIVHVRRNKNAASIHDSFNSDKSLLTALRFLFKDRPTCNAPQLHSVLGITMSNCFNTFPCMRMKAICELLCPPQGIVYDFSAGFGSRMLGCLSSRNNYTYIGVDPNQELHYHERYQKLGDLIQEAFNQTPDANGRIRQVQAHVECIGSEDYRPRSLLNQVDLAFSSPPYWSREYYTDDDTQCYNKFPTLQEWLEGYVRDTVVNIYALLKKGGLVAFNICDFGSVKYVDEWIKIVQQQGFKMISIISAQKESRIGSGHDRTETKTEEIYVFKKT